MSDSCKSWAEFAGFDPEDGAVVVAPPGESEGYWVGAPSVTYDPQSKYFYLVYRVRRPRGVEPDRGAEVHIARSSDGTIFDDVWTGYKDALDSTSIERCALHRFDGRWTLVISYVDPADGRWRIDAVESDSPESFDLQQRRPLLDAAGTQTEGVKDPFLFRVGNLWHMIASFATPDAGADASAMHATNDAYNTGLIKSRTGLATSSNGRDWNWEGEILGPPASGWDSYCTRIGCVWREDGIWLALYDGSADVSENYEERVGLAYSHDLRHWRRTTAGGPLMRQPHGRGALRYFDTLTVGEDRLFYYETSRPDGSHDLRVYSA